MTLLRLKHCFAFILPFLSSFIMEALVYRQFFSAKVVVQRAKGMLEKKPWGAQGYMAPPLTWPLHKKPLGQWSVKRMAISLGLASPRRIFSEFWEYQADLELLKNQPSEENHCGQNQKVGIAASEDMLLEAITSLWPFISLFKETDFCNRRHCPHSLPTQAARNALKHKHS